MAKLKGCKKLNKAITAQFKPFGITKVIGADDYAYYFDDAIVTFRLNITDSDEAFSKFVKERFNFEDDNIFMLSLLHEVGHHVTDDDINENIYNFCKQEKDRIESEIYNLPDEIMATQWAVDYIKKHPKKVRKMWNKCEKALHEFYAKNLG